MRDEKEGRKEKANKQQGKHVRIYIYNATEYKMNL